MVDNMEWFNVFGLIFIAVIMIPNVVFAIKCKDGFDNKWNNKYVEVTEQVGRLGCFGFMIINIPGTWFGWWSDETFAVYLIVDTILVMLYCAIWIICFKKNSIFRALALSIIPSMLFLFSGIMSRSVLLIIASVVFAPSHIVISYKNVKWYLQLWICKGDIQHEESLLSGFASFNNSIRIITLWSSLYFCNISNRKSKRNILIL